MQLSVVIPAHNEAEDLAPVIATLDGDGQNVPRDLPAMISRLTMSPPSEKVSMVNGVRRQ